MTHEIHVSFGSARTCIAPERFRYDYGQKLVFERRRLLVRQAAALDAMSPLKVLSRGYVAAADGHGAPVGSVRQLSRGDRVRLRFSDGRADCLVEQVEEEERHGT